MAVEQAPAAGVEDTVDVEDSSLRPPELADDSYLEEAVACAAAVVDLSFLVDLDLDGLNKRKKRALLLLLASVAVDLDLDLEQQSLSTSSVDAAVAVVAGDDHIQQLAAEAALELDADAAVGA